MSKALTEIRKKIDALDDKIHDVLMERAALIVDIVEEKKKHNLQFVHPAREAKMIRRLLARHKGSLPEATIVGIWRELVGGVSLLQTGLSVSVFYDEDTDVKYWDMAKSYFGRVVPMKRVSSSLYAIASVREGEASFAVLPWPQEETEDPWWLHLIANEAQKEIRIVGALPYGQTEQEANSSASKALVISKVSFSDSGDDHSFLVLTVESGVSKARVYDVLKGLDLNPLSIVSHTRQADPYRTIFLIEVDKYIEADSDLLIQINKKFHDYEGESSLLGGYPVPPVFSNSQSLFGSGSNNIKKRDVT